MTTEATWAPHEEHGRLSGQAVAVGISVATGTAGRRAANDVFLGVVDLSGLNRDLCRP